MKYVLPTPQVVVLQTPPQPKTLQPRTHQHALETPQRKQVQEVRNSSPVLVINAPPSGQAFRASPIPEPIDGKIIIHGGIQNLITGNHSVIIYGEINK